MTSQPHILIFNPDQWRGDILGHAGNPGAVTPNVDRLVAEDAVSFRHAFCQNPVCTPSRCSFMTGWYPHVRGHRSMHHMLRPDEPMLLKALKNHGYFVWWGGKNDVVRPEDGWDRYCHVKHAPTRQPAPMWAMDRQPTDPARDGYYAMHFGVLEPTPGDAFYHDADWAHVLGAIELIRDAPKGRPLCIYLPLVYPHPPYAVERRWLDQIDASRLPPRVPAPSSWDAKPSLLRELHARQDLAHWDEARWNALRATYYGMCARVDHQFGLVVEALREAGLYDDTAIFFFSDHGDFTGDYGLVEKTQNTFEDCLTRVPLLTIE